MPGKKNLQQLYAPVRFVSSVSSHRSSGMSAKFTALAMPALLIRICATPHREAVCSARRFTCCRSVMSHGNARTWRPFVAISAAVALSFTASRAVTTTRQPCAAKPCANARPKPPLPPVTRAIFCSKPLITMQDNTSRRLNCNHSGCTGLRSGRLSDKGNAARIFGRLGREVCIDFIHTHRRYFACRSPGARFTTPNVRDQLAGCTARDR